MVKNQINGKVYIGQSLDLDRRMYDHARLLRLQKHHNIHLQREYDKYGADAFSITIAEECDIESLDEREVYWISHYGSLKNSVGYNMEGGGNAGKIVSDETRNTKRGANNPMYGKKLSIGHIESLRIKNRSNSKILDEQRVAVIKQRMANGEVRSEIASDYSVSCDVLDKIATCDNWQWVREDLNETIKNLTQRRRAERDATIFKLDKQGMSRAAIARAAGCYQTTVARILGCSSKEVAAKRDAAILQDYLSGIDRKEIMKKHGVCQSVYTKAISAELNRQLESEKQKAVELRDSGWMVKDIAKAMGYARTTISRWTRESSQHRGNGNHHPTP